MMQSTKERTGYATIGSCTKAIVAKYARFACAINLQQLADLLDNCWAFSVALDMSAHFSTSYLDIRIRIHVNSTLLNAHVLAIPVFERHTGENMYKTAEKAFDALHGNWKNKIVGISTDGEKKMTGQISGVATRFQEIAKPGFIRVWCGAHQLDIALQKVYSSYGNEEFYRKLTSLISYLRRQYNLIQDMKTKAPALSDTRWESMHRVSDWFKKHRVEVDAYLEAKSPVCKPDAKWWAQLMIIKEFSSHSSFCFRALQGHTTTIAAQRVHIEQLRETLITLVKAKGPLSENEYNELDKDHWAASESKIFAVKRDNVKEFVFNQGNFVQSKLQGLDDDKLGIFIKDVGILFLESINSIASIAAEQNQINEAATEESRLPPVLPQEVGAIQHSDFYSIV